VNFNFFYQGVVKMKMSKKPLISIITVVFNGEEHISECIDSVIKQTYKNIEHIIIDGGSKDKTIEIIKRFNDQISYWVSEPDNGIYDAMNKGSSIAKGDYALFLNSDDYLFNENSVEKAVNAAISKTSLPLLVVGQIIHAIKDREIINWKYPLTNDDLSQGNPPHPSTFIHSSIYRRFPYKTMYSFAGDYDLWEALRNNGLYNVCFVDSIISVFRMGGASTSGDNEFMVTVELELSNYINRREFSLSTLIRSRLKYKIKNIIVLIIGQNNFHRIISYRSYLAWRNKNY
jgi:glycosyltransferase involved in cell wall biosynthesis